MVGASSQLHIRFREYRNFTCNANNKVDRTICRVCMINHFASICETKVACRNYPNIISPSGEEGGRFLATAACTSTPIRKHVHKPTYSYSDVALVKLNRESIVSLFRSGRCYKLRQFIVSRAQSNLKDPPNGRASGPQPDRADDHPSNLVHN